MIIKELIWSIDNQGFDFRLNKGEIVLQDVGNNSIGILFTKKLLAILTK